MTALQHPTRPVACPAQVSSQPPPASLGTQPPEHSVPATNTDSRHPGRRQPAPTPSEPQAGRSGRSSSAPGPRSSVHSARTKQQPAAENAHIRSPKARDQNDLPAVVNRAPNHYPTRPRPRTAHPRPTVRQRTRFSPLTCTPPEGPWGGSSPTPLRITPTHLQTHPRQIRGLAGAREAPLVTPPTLRRSSAADGNAKAKRYMLGVPNGTTDLGDLHRRPCGPAHRPTQPDPCDLRASAHLMPDEGRHCTAVACRPYCPACSCTRGAAAWAR